MAIASWNPATGETLGEFTPLNAGEIEAKLMLGEGAFEKHRRRTFAERARLMRAAAEVLESEQETFARTITSEMGKLLAASAHEVLKCARVCRFYADNAEQFLAEHDVAAAATRSYIRYEPLGAILAVMPWNFPFWQVFRFAAPALMAGNVGLLKHAPNVPQCALAIDDIFRRADFDAGCFQALLIETEQTRAIIDDPRVKAVTLTGSERAGAEVASAAARQIKKAVLELGGSDPFIVMPSADLKAALNAGLKSRMINIGQSCIAAKRFIVAEAVYAAFVSDFAAKMKALRVGDPLDPQTEVGPLANEQILAGVDAQVKASVAAGAKLLTGGRRIERPGCFYEPTVLADVPRDSPAACEEIFGPVAAFFRAQDADAAVTLANDTPFGLGASVWTKDGDEQRFFAERIDAGMVFINAMVASDPRLPFGGIKRSGFGRELGAEGIREFVNAKTVVVA